MRICLEFREGYYARHIRPSRKLNFDRPRSPPTPSGPLRPPRPPPTAVTFDRDGTFAVDAGLGQTPSHSPIGGEGGPPRSTAASPSVETPPLARPLGGRRVRDRRARVFPAPLENSSTVRSNRSLVLGLIPGWNSRDPFEVIFQSERFPVKRIMPPIVQVARMKCIRSGGNPDEDVGEAPAVVSVTARARPRRRTPRSSPLLRSR